MSLLTALPAQEETHPLQLHLGSPALSIKDPTNSQWLSNRVFGITKLANNPSSLNAVMNLDQNRSNSLTFSHSAFAHIEETFQRQFTKTIFGSMRDCIDVEALHFFDQIQFRRQDLAILSEQNEANTFWPIVNQKDRLPRGTLNPLRQPFVGAPFVGSWKMYTTIKY